MHDFSFLFAFGFGEWKQPANDPPATKKARFRRGTRSPNKNRLRCRFERIRRCIRELAELSIIHYGGFVNIYNEKVRKRGLISTIWGQLCYLILRIIPFSFMFHGLFRHIF